jgi:hypothetical protein
MGKFNCKRVKNEKTFRHEKLHTNRYENAMFLFYEMENDRYFGVMYLNFNLRRFEPLLGL